MTPDDLDQFRATLVRRGIRPTVSDLVRANDAAKVLGLAPKTLRNWRSDGRGPEFTTIGGGVFYPLASLAAFIDAGRGRPVRPGTAPRVLDRSKRTRHHGAVNLSRLETRLPPPVAAAIRELAQAEGTTPARLIEDALRDYAPIATALKSTDTSRKSDAAKTP